MKINRQEVLEKYDYCCAYCGEPIIMKRMQVDHIIPKQAYSERLGCLVVDGRKFTKYGLNDLQNLNPACRPCNNFKSVWSLEEFRREIEAQVERARKRSVNFRTAERFKQVLVEEKHIVFYFELPLESRQT